MHRIDLAILIPDETVGEGPEAVFDFVVASMKPHCLFFKVPPYKVYASPADVRDFSLALGVPEGDLTALAEAIMESGEIPDFVHDIGLDFPLYVDDGGLYHISVFNEDWRWDSCLIGGQDYSIGSDEHRDLEVWPSSARGQRDRSRVIRELWSRLLPAAEGLDHYVATGEFQFAAFLLPGANWLDDPSDRQIGRFRQGHHVLPLLCHC